MRKQAGFQQFSLIVLCTKTPKPLAILWQWAAPSLLIRVSSPQLVFQLSARAHLGSEESWTIRSTQGGRLDRRQYLVMMHLR